MITITFRPWDVWPGEATKPYSRKSRGVFKASWQTTMDLLTRELEMVYARDVVIQLNCRESDIRRDGLPKADARPGSPGVILAFTHRQAGGLRYPCDTYDHWEANVRAIALALQALRAVDRYGVTKRGEQYSGWKAIPASTSATLTPTIAADMLARMTGRQQTDILRDRQVFESARRSALGASHPDRTNGNADQFNRATEAIEVLRAHHEARV